MTRLIDADAITDELIKGIEADTGKSVQTTFTKSVCMILCKAIEQQSTIDAEPVRHGKWTADEILYTQGMTACSCCKTEYYRDDLYMVGNNAQGELPNYCPNCGADMRGEQDE